MIGQKLCECMVGNGDFPAMLYTLSFFYEAFEDYICRIRLRSEGNSPHETIKNEDTI